ncbi:hypothetical protein B0H10DRAFT_2389326 [Mycena sp. CBHHK59/15]|nr:hypothetical protein B0H10DRAFT_2389326 [Mycena sp. CBHHK59/15]
MGGGAVLSCAEGWPLACGGCGRRGAHRRAGGHFVALAVGAEAEREGDAPAPAHVAAGLLAGHEGRDSLPPARSQSPSSRPARACCSRRVHVPGRRIRRAVLRPRGRRARVGRVTVTLEATHHTSGLPQRFGERERVGGGTSWEEDWLAWVGLTTFSRVPQPIYISRSFLSHAGQDYVRSSGASSSTSTARSSGAQGGRGYVYAARPGGGKSFVLHVITGAIRPNPVIIRTMRVGRRRLEGLRVCGRDAHERQKRLGAPAGEKGSGGYARGGVCSLELDEGNGDFVVLPSVDDVSPCVLQTGTMTTCFRRRRRATGRTPMAPEAAAAQGQGWA